MESNLLNQLVSLKKSISSQMNDQDLSIAPIGDKFQQMLVSLLLATTLSKIGKVHSSSENPHYTSLKLNESDLRPKIPPVNGILTQGFHASHPGMDFGIPIGTPVKATMDGIIIHAGWNNEGYGNLVIIHNGEYTAYFAHLSEIPVKVGDQVRSGTTIGLTGSTGNSTGPHLHYEVRAHNKPVNPVHFNVNPYPGRRS